MKSGYIEGFRINHLMNILIYSDFIKPSIFDVCEIRDTPNQMSLICRIKGFKLHNKQGTFIL